MASTRILVIGAEDAVFGLRLAGLEGRAVATLDEARAALRAALADPGVGLVLLTEDWTEARDAAADEATPVVEVPGPGAAPGAGAMQAQVERALGVHFPAGEAAGGAG